MTENQRPAFAELERTQDALERSKISMPDELSKFRRELMELLNRTSLPCASGTPASILADYLVTSLAAFSKAQERRDIICGPECAMPVSFDEAPIDDFNEELPNICPNHENTN
jgi:hypothetical protein